MPYDPEIHHRRSIRLKGYDYTQAGAYFITVCAKDRECLFGKIINGEMKLNEFVIMPNHMHGIVVLNGIVGERHAVPLQPNAKPKHVEQFGKPVSGSIPTIVRSFKSAAARHINIRRDSPCIPVWQRNYFEHIIRDENALHQIRRYIIQNPLNWKTDEQNILIH